MTPSSSLPQTTAEWSFEAIGTQWWIGMYGPVRQLHLLQEQIAERIDVFDITYSRFRPDSLVTKLSQQAGSFTFPDDIVPLSNWYRQLYDASDGTVTPLIGQTISDAGYDANYSFQNRKPIPPPAWDEVLTITGSTVTTSAPVLLDFGATGKGYLIDIIAELIRQAGMQAFCIDAGGDLMCTGMQQPLRIGLENPQDTSQAIGVAEISQGALCASAGSRRKWGHYHHIINPHSVSSPTEILAVWATAETAMIADGLTTALFFKQPSELVGLSSYEFAILYTDGHLEHSRNFPATFF